MMSFTRWFFYMSFASGVVALSFQPSGIAHATPSPILLVADQSSSSSQDGQRNLRSGKTGTANAEVSGKMQKDRDALSGGENMNPSSRVDGKASQGQGSEAAPGSANSGALGSSGSSPSSGNSSMGGGSGTSGAGTSGGSR
ncbi:MAG: hypothetical protein ABIP43_07030 [Nitrospiraceae bacterium]